jgi:hypothetical protein
LIPSQVHSRNVTVPTYSSHSNRKEIFTTSVILIGTNSISLVLGISINNRDSLIILSSSIVVELGRAFENTEVIASLVLGVPTQFSRGGMEDESFDACFLT